MLSNDPALKKVVATNIKNQRERLGLTQEQLANRLGRKVPYINKIERQPQNLTISMLSEIAKALGTTAEALLVEAKLEFSSDIAVDEFKYAVDTLVRLKESALALKK